MVCKTRNNASWEIIANSHRIFTPKIYTAPEGLSPLATTRAPRMPVGIEVLRNCRREPMPEMIGAVMMVHEIVDVVKKMSRA